MYQMAMALPTLFSAKFTAPLAHVRLQTVSTRPGFRINSINVPTQAHTRVNNDDWLEAGRRSSNCPPNSWDYKWLESLGTGYSNLVNEEGLLTKMKDQVRDMIDDKAMLPLDKLVLIDAVQRLGMEYHFEASIKDALQLIHVQASDGGSAFDDLHSTALLFRLLRQHGLHVQTDVFDKFKEEGSFKEVIGDDVNGMLSLYEASFHGFTCETILDEARAFALSHLKNLDLDGVLPTNLAKKVRRAFDLPLRWRSNRSEARWFIDIYPDEPKSIPFLLQLAKLDFNHVQSHYRDEVHQLAGWWMDLDLGDVKGLRDRLMESYLWGNITGFEPQMGYSRVITSKLASLITLIDDCYDLFGTMEELELLTDFIDRWDVREIDKLPPTIRTSYWAVYNSTNEIAYKFFKLKGVNVLPHLHKMWATQCKEYLQEARWYYNGYKPKLEEYIDCSVTTIGVFSMLFPFFFGTTEVLSEEAFSFVHSIPRIMRDSALATRLINDLGTSKHELERGDVLKAMQCYMNEHGAPEEIAREAIESSVHEAWKSMNEQEFEEYPNFISRSFIRACLNMARSSHYFYRYADEFGYPSRDIKDYLTSLVVDPVYI